MNWLLSTPEAHSSSLIRSQHDRLATSADTSQDFYQVVSDERTDTAHIGFPFNHIDLPPFFCFYDITDILDSQAIELIFNGYNR